MKNDKQIAKQAADIARSKKKSSVPQDNYGDHYVDPVSKSRTQGKGDNYRDIPGWYSDEIKERLEEIFGKKEANEENPKK